MPVVENDFDLADLLGQTQRMMMTQAKAKDLALSVHVSARTPLRLKGDDRRLREILLNLVSNAVKFTRHGGIIIAVDKTASSEAGDRLRFEGSDTGIGIEQDALDRIFETFEQANPRILDNYGGTGLGLAITKKLVLLLGGRIGVTSAVEKGSRLSRGSDAVGDHGAVRGASGHSPVQESACGVGFGRSPVGLARAHSGGDKS